MKNIDKKIWIFIGSVAIIILLFVSLSINRSAPEEIVSPEEISSSVIRYIDETFIQGGAVIELIEIVEESGVYKIRLDIDGMELDTYATKDGKIFFPEGLLIKGEGSVILEKTIGNFTKTGEETCFENGKPIVYYFGSSDCPYCQWQKPVVTEAMRGFEEYLSFKDNSDTDNDLDIFFKYSEGGVPLIVAGCNYFRVGAGINSSEEEDAAIISALACDLTGGQPREICENLDYLINQI